MAWSSLACVRSNYLAQRRALAAFTGSASRAIFLLLSLFLKWPSGCGPAEPALLKHVLHHDMKTSITDRQAGVLHDGVVEHEVEDLGQEGLFRQQIHEANDVAQGGLALDPLDEGTI
jgi:hypothetical protein